MSADVLLARLEKVKRTGVDRWVACCPAHEDKTPSLAVRELPDGTTLIRCFAGCSAEEIVTAAGLALADLFPKKLNGDDRAAPARRPWSDRQLLEVVDRETIIVFIAACDVTLEGKALSDIDMTRLRKARERITAVMGALP